MFEDGYLDDFHTYPIINKHASSLCIINALLTFVLCLFTDITFMYTLLLCLLSVIPMVSLSELTFGIFTYRYVSKIIEVPIDAYHWMKNAFYRIIGLYIILIAFFFIYRSFNNITDSYDEFMIVFILGTIFTVFVIALSLSSMKCIKELWFNIHRRWVKDEIDKKIIKTIFSKKGLR